MRKQFLAVTIGVLLVLSVFSVLQFGQIKPVYAATFGVEGNGTNEDGGAGWLVLCKYNMPVDGQIMNIAVLYHSSSTPTHGIGCLYSDVAGTPTALLAESASTAINLTDWTWVEFALTVPYDGASGDYWLGFTIDDDAVSRFNYTAGSVHQGAIQALGSGYPTLPNPFVVGAWMDRAVCIHADYTPAATAPTCGVGSPSSTKNWTSCVISAQFNASAGGNISKVFVDTNVTGAWSGNVTLTPTWKNSTGCWGNYTMLLPATEGTVVGYRWFANDTSDNWVDSGNYTLTTTANTINYSENAIWIQNAAWGGFPVAKQNILNTNISGLANDCGNYSIKYAFVFVGYWNSSSNNIVYEESDSVWTATISALHASGVKALAWAEDGYGIMDISSGNRQNIYNSIIALMYKGFDGYNDDVEGSMGVLQDYIDYVNNCTTVLHSMGKLMTVDVGYDWQQNINMHLNVDFIVSMFYTSKSVFEDTQAYAYYQEDFGLYGSDHGAPASPMILGIINYYANTYPLCWQLAQTAYCMNTYSNRSLVGFCLWNYEYLGSLEPDDWSQWNYWVTQLSTTPAVLHTIALGSSPTVGVGITLQGTTKYTNTTVYTFNISQSLVVSSSQTLETLYSLFGMTNHTSAGGYSSYTYCSGPYTLGSPTSVSSVYFYAKQAGNVKIAIYNITTYTIGGWLGTNEHPHILQSQSNATACTANAWTLVNVSSVTLASGDYFIVVKGDTTGMIGGYGDGTSAFYGHGQYITQSYSTAFSTTFPTVEGGTGGDPATFVPTAPIALTPYTFTEWEDSSTNPTRTISTVTSNITVTAYYTSETVPSISLIYPLNITYSSGTIPVNFTASGGTIDQYWYNVLNGTSGSTWVYVSNQTFTTYTTMTGFINGTYTFYGFANNTVPTIGYSTVVFTVLIITSEGGTVELIVNTWWSGFW